MTGKYITTSFKKQQKENCVYRGFYLVHSSGRFFISEKVSEAALERVCDKVLTDDDYEYWIDYSHGLDVSGYIHWANVDQIDRFI